jgi:hypothetical protein
MVSRAIAGSADTPLRIRPSLRRSPGTSSVLVRPTVPPRYHLPLLIPVADVKEQLDRPTLCSSVPRLSRQLAAHDALSLCLESCIETTNLLKPGFLSFSPLQLRIRF